jgi:hypothetical protein
METILSQFSLHHLQHNNLRSILILLYHLHIYFQSAFFNFENFLQILGTFEKWKKVNTGTLIKDMLTCLLNSY